MYSINETKLVNEVNAGNAEIKIIPLDGYYIIQIASEPIHGTLLIMNDIDEEELVDLGKALHAMIQHFELGAAEEGEVGS
jgi:hypothetical protein